MQRYLLRFRCPFCPNSNEVINWPHAPCGGYEHIYEDGFIQCDDWGKKYPLESAMFNCSHCSNDYRPSFDHDPERAYYIFKIISSINEEIGDKEFVGKLIHNVFKRFCK